VKQVSPLPLAPRTAQGRILTAKGYGAIGLKAAGDQQTPL
jgi:hypothetical protein